MDDGGRAVNAGTRLYRRGLQGARRHSRYLLLLLLGVFIAGTLAASPASAVPAGIPLIDVCPKDAPIAIPPTVGLASSLGERPLVITTDDSPEHIWTTGGFAGLQRGTYDLGCAANPASYLRMAEANANNKVANAFIGVSSGITAITDSVDRRAWSPTWIIAFMGDFTERATESIKYSAVIPLLGIGLILSSVMLLIKFRHGNMAGAASAVAWTIVVVTLSALVLAAPVMAAQTAQQAGATTISALNKGGPASDAQTNRIVYNVMYQSWLRRTFGSENSTVAEVFGPRLLMSERITWSELDNINRLEKDKRPEALEKLREKKADDFKDIAAKIKEQDADAYRWLTGENDASGLALLEAAYSLVASFFRLAVDLLAITCVIMLTVMGMAWLIGSPWIVTPTGQGMGLLLLNNSARGIGYIITAAIGSWVFGIYMLTAMQPGQSAWWSLLLLLLGTIVAWTMIRPDRKMLSLMTMGHVNGTGAVTRMLGRLLMAYVGGRVGGAAAARAVNEHDDEDEPAAEPERSEDQSAPSPRPHIIYATADPAPNYGAYADSHGIPAQAEYVEGEVIDDVVDNDRGLPKGAYAQPTGDLRGIPASQPIYQRSDPGEEDAEVVDATPPPPDSVGEVEIYQRPATGHVDDEYVTCPWCNGRKCGHCEQTGVVPRWVAREVTEGANF